MIKSSIFSRYDNKLNYYQLVGESSIPYHLNSEGNIIDCKIELTTSIVGGREYLDDFKPFSDLFTLKSIFMHVVKASLVPANLIVHEYNVHLMDSLELDESEREEFDWNKSLLKNFALFIATWKRMMSVSFIRKVLEELSVNYLSLRVADKLSKDLGKSILRKSLKFSRFVACKKIFVTALYSSCLYHCSSFIYDVGFVVTSVVMEKDGEEKKSIVKKFNEKKIVELCLKKFGYFSVCLISSAGGYAIGSYFHLKYGGSAVSLVTEMIGGVSFSILVGI